VKKLIDIPGTDPSAVGLLESGIFPSLPAKQPKLWLDAQNALFVDRGVEKARGFEELGTVSGGDINAMTQAYVDGERRVYLGTGGKLLRYADGVTVTLNDTYAGAGRWSMIPWGNWLLATQGSKVQVSKNDNTAVDLAGVPKDNVRIIRKLAQRPIIFYGQEAAWPRATDIEAWATPDPEGRAGNFFIRDLDSDVVAVEPLGELLAYYTKNKMGLVTFIGGTSVYGFKNRLEGIGAIGLNAIVPVGQLHYGMGTNGIWRTDGSSYAYLDQPAINRFFDANLDKSRGEEVVGVHIKDRSMVEWHFPNLSGDIIGLGYNYGNGSWQALKKGITAALTQEVFDYPIAARGGKWGLYDKTDNLGAETLPSELQTGGFDAGEGMRFKWWDKVDVYGDFTVGTDVRFLLHKRPTWGQDPDDRMTDWTTLQQENWIQQESVYLSMQLRTQGLNTNWRIGGLSVWGEIAGLVS